MSTLSDGRPRSRSRPRLRRVAGLPGRLLWLVRELNGEHAYERYATRARAAGEPVLTRRAFEHRRTDRRDADPREGGRCC
ncbi:CstA-like transporter-associated (seleno)protein (plasmid) [Streptomyces sp. BI20]|uniref:CstA-like transporter-associated (seleno)protein n=1 Tax=Streptomyces sp. BI20 TaxID=3403460 RepID=UPI003C75EE5A